MSSPIWTHHARDRVGQRGLSQHMVLETVHKPDATVPGKRPGTIEYQKSYGASRVTVIVSLNEKRERVLLSCWIDPPIYGTADWKDRQYYHEYRKARTWWQQLWIVLKKQLGV